MRSGRYFEDLDIGESFATSGRTVTEADLVAFAGVSGDFNPIHMNAEVASNGRFGQRVVHGVLGISIATGLIDRLGIFEASMIAMLGIDDWRFESPLFVGDTVHVELEIADKRRTSRGHAGIVRRRIRLVNQKGETLQEGTITVMLRCRETTGVANDV